MIVNVVLVLDEDDLTELEFEGVEMNRDQAGEVCKGLATVLKIQREAVTLLHCLSSSTESEFLVKTNFRNDLLEFYATNEIIFLTFRLSDTRIFSDLIFAP